MIKLSLLAVSTVAVFSGSCSSPLDDAPVHGSTSGFENTTFVPSLSSSLDPAQNQLWCGTLQLSYGALVDSMGSEFDAGRLDAVSALVHNDPFGPESVDANSYVAVAGEDTDRVIELAQKQLMDKFGRERDPMLDSLRGSGVPLAYAYLAKSMPFPEVFEDLAERPFKFGAAKTDVEAWGLGEIGMDPFDHKALAEGVKVIHYGGRDDFVLEFKPVGNERIVLARMKPGKTLAATWATVQAQRVAAKLSPPVFGDRPIVLRQGQTLIVPKIDFDLSHIFPALSTGADGGEQASALQRLRVRLDQKGAEVVSEVVILVASAAEQEPLEFIFDGPFLAAFIEGDATVPFAAMWIADADLLVPR